ncbi:MAG TPA: metallopeptidase TldD-related protein [Nannocystis sp.]
MDGAPQTALAPFTGAIAVDAQVAGRVLRAALADGGEYADLFFEHRRSLHVSLEDGRVRSVVAGIDAGVGIRVVQGGSVGFAYAESFEPAVMLAAARTAAQVARARGVRRSTPRTRTPDRAPAALDPLPAVACIEVLRRVDRGARRADPAIVRVEASLSVSRREILIVTSEAAPVHDVQPLLRLGVTAIATRDGRREAGATGGGGRVGLEHFTAHTPERYGQEAARIAVVNLDARPAPAGTLPVVLAPGDAGIWLHEAVGHGLEADFIRKRSSSYSDRVNHQVAPPCVTLLDDPGVPGGRGSLAVDDEGVVPGVHLLVDRGVLRGLLHDRTSARTAGLAPTGSGRRQSFRDLPLPRMSNTWLAAGDEDPADIVRSVQRGIYAAGFSGGQVNIAAGDFVFALTEGYLIEDGKITAPLRGVHLIGHGPTALAAVSRVGHDLRMSDGTWTCTKDGQNVPVGVGMPTVKIDALTIGGECGAAR